MTRTHCKLDICGTCWRRRMTESKAYQRAQEDYLQDACENAPFNCIGGLAARSDPKRPKWIEPADWPTYLLGYTDAAHEHIGPGWATAEFGWKPAITINDATGGTGRE